MTDPARFTDSLAPTQISSASTYSSTPAGPTRRAALRVADDTLGYVWTDDQAAAGWVPEGSSVAAVQAGAYVWAVLAAAHRRGDPPASVLNPVFYAPIYELGDISRA